MIEIRGRSFQRVRLLLMGILALIVAPAGSIGDESDKPAAPLNVLFVLVDDWGWTDAGCLGSDLYETPNIDRLAATGVRFTDAYSACTVCSPTRAAVMTGMYPARTRVTDWIPGHGRPKAPLRIPDWTQRLELSYTTMAEALGAVGYRTAHVGKWHLSSINEVGQRDFWPERQGFDVNIGGTKWGAPGSYFWPYSRPGRPMWNMPPGQEGDYLTDALTDNVLTILKTWKDEPFFIYLPFYTVHTPIQGKADLISSYRAKVKPGMRHTDPEYAAMVASLDKNLGRILDQLDALGLTDRTAIFLTGDNGGLESRRSGGPTNNDPLREGKGSSYEGGVRVPGIVRVPGLTPTGVVSDEPILSIDYYPTILKLTGAPGVEEHNDEVDGLDLGPVLADPEVELDRDALYWHYPHYHPGGAVPHSAIRMRDWRLVEFHNGMRVELYNLQEDLGETQDLAEERPEVRDRLRDRLHAWRERLDAQMPTPNPDYKPSASGSSGR